MLLYKSKHVPLSTASHFFKLSTFCIHFSHFSSKERRNFTNPETNTLESIVLTKPIASKSVVPSKSTSSKFIISAAKLTLPNSPISHKTSSSDVNSISSMLSYNISCTEDIDNFLDSYQGELNSNIVLQVLMSYKQLGRLKTLKFFPWAGAKMGFHFDDRVVEYMADFLGRRKLFDDMKCLLITLSKYKGRISCRTLSICIRFLGRQGRIREAFSLFEEMETVFGCKPDTLVYNNMLFVLCKKQSSGELVDLALAIFQRIESPDTYSYSNILVGLCKLGRLEAALEIFGQMNKVHVLPTRSALNILIGELCLMSAKEGSIKKVRVGNTRRPYTILVPSIDGNSGAIEPAMAVFWAVLDSGLLPSTFIMAKLMTELCRLGKTNEAIKILKIAEERKLTCVEEAYTIVIKALCDQRQVKETSNLFGRMLAHGLKPKLVVYNSVISMLCKVGSLGGATGVFEILNKNRCFPDSLTYTALIHAHSEEKNWEIPYELLMEMLGLGLMPQFGTYILVDNLLRKHNRLDLCLKLETKLENQKLQKLCKTGQLDAAYEKLKSMLERGFPPSAYTRDTLKHEFQKCGKLNIACQLLQMIEKNSVTRGA